MSYQPFHPCEGCPAFTALEGCEKQQRERFGLAVTEVVMKTPRDTAFHNHDVVEKTAAKAVPKYEIGIENDEALVVRCAIMQRTDKCTKPAFEATRAVEPNTSYL